MDPATSGDALFSDFYNEVKAIEKQDSVLTSEEQIKRLLRPGSVYLNLNPYEVLQIKPTSSEDDIKKQYRKLSILVHPDKNPDDRERAQQAFDIVNKAYKTLENVEATSRIQEILEEGKARADAMVKEKRRAMKRQGKDSIEEDCPDKYEKLVYVTTVKVFIEKARKRKELEERDAEERKRKREAEIEAEEKKKMEQEFIKNYEESREDRVSSWKDFQTKKKSKTKTSAGEFKPPKLKPEQRQ